MTKSISARSVRLSAEPLEAREVPALFPIAPTAVVVSPDDGGIPVVRLVDGTTGADLGQVQAYEDAFRGGVHASLGDVTGDGVRDLVLSPGKGGGPRVRIIDGSNGNVLKDFFVYEPTFTGGITVALGDVTGDGKADLVTGTGVGGGPRIRVLDGASLGDKVLNDFFAYEDAFRGGVLVAAGDINADGTADIVAGTGVGGGPRVRVLDGKSLGDTVLDDYFAYDSSFRGGVFVATGDVNGDGHDDVITGTGVGGGPIVRVRSGNDGSDLGQFLADDPGFRGGVRVSSSDLNGDGRADILVGIRHGNDDAVRVFDGPNGQFVSTTSRVVDDSATPVELMETHDDHAGSAPTTAGRIRNLEGTLVSVDAAANTIAMRLANGTTEVVTTAAVTEIKRDKVRVTTAAFQVGDKIEALIGPDGIAWELEAKSSAFVEGKSGRDGGHDAGVPSNHGNGEVKPASAIEGTIAALDLGNRMVSVRIASGTTTIVPVSATAKIERNSSTAVFADLIVGDRIELKLDAAGTVLKLEATAAAVVTLPVSPPVTPPVTPPSILTPAANSKLEGTITAVDAAASTIMMSVQNGTRYRVQATSGTKIERRGQRTTLALLKVGDVVEVKIAGDGFADKIETSSV